MLFSESESESGSEVEVEEEPKKNETRNKEGVEGNEQQSVNPVILKNLRDIIHADRY